MYEKLIKFTCEMILEFSSSHSITYPWRELAKGEGALRASGEAIGVEVVEASSGAQLGTPSTSLVREPAKQAR